MRFPEPGECGCRRCSEAWDKANAPEGADILWKISQGRSSRFIVCETCGNKRCPHATNHIYACTNSNESGQLGSDYQ